MNGIKVLFGVFRVEFFLAAAEHENDADEDQEKRKDRQQNARDDADQGDVFGVRIGRRSERPVGNDKNNRTDHDTQNSQTQRDFPKHSIVLLELN